MQPVLCDRAQWQFLAPAAKRVENEVPQPPTNAVRNVPMRWSSVRSPRIRIDETGMEANFDWSRQTTPTGTDQATFNLWKRGSAEWVTWYPNEDEIGLQNNLNQDWHGISQCKANESKATGNEFGNIRKNKKRLSSSVSLLALKRWLSKRGEKTCTDSKPAGKPAEAEAIDQSANRSSEEETPDGNVARRRTRRCAMVPLFASFKACKSARLCSNSTVSADGHEVYAVATSPANCGALANAATSNKSENKEGKRRIKSPPDTLRMPPFEQHVGIVCQTAISPDGIVQHTFSSERPDATAAVQPHTYVADEATDRNAEVVNDSLPPQLELMMNKMRISWDKKRRDRPGVGTSRREKTQTRWTCYASFGPETTPCTDSLLGSPYAFTVSPTGDFAATPHDRTVTLDELRQTSMMLARGGRTPSLAAEACFLV